MDGNRGGARRRGRGGGEILVEVGVRPQSGRGAAAGAREVARWQGPGTWRSSGDSGRPRGGGGSQRVAQRQGGLGGDGIRGSGWKVVWWIEQFGSGCFLFSFFLSLPVSGVGEGLRAPL